MFTTLFMSIFSSKTKIEGNFIISSAKTGSSRPEVFCKKGVLENLAKFTGKHLCQSLSFNKLYLKRDSGTCVFL